MYLVPHGPLIPENLSAPALDAIPRISESSVSVGSTCSGADGESRWRAAGSARARGKEFLDQHGLFALVCVHRRFLRLLAMTSPEACSREHIMGLFLAAALGARDALSDIVCIMLKHIRAQGERDFSDVLNLLTGCFLKANVTLSVDGDGKFARFVLKHKSANDSENVGEDDGSAAASASSGDSESSTRGGTGDDKPSFSCPSSAADFSMHGLILRLLARIDAAGPDGLSIVCSIPAMHQIAHQCRLYLGCTATPSAGAGSEVCEMSFGRDISPFASVARNMSAASWRLYWNLRAALSNQRQSVEDPVELLKFVFRALLLVQRRTKEFETLCQAYRVNGGFKSISSYDLRSAAQDRALRVANASAAPKAVKMTSATATIAIFKSKAQLRVLNGIREDSLEVTDGASRDGFIALSTKEAGFKSIRSEVALKRKIEVVGKTCIRLSRLRGVVAFDVNAVIALNLTSLRQKATQLAVNSMELDRHRVNRSGKTVLAGNRSIHSSIVADMHNIMGTLRILLPLSPTDTVREYVLPTVNDIRGPSDLPDQIGPIIIEPGDVMYERVVTGFLELQCAHSQLEIARNSMRTAPAVASAIILRLQGMLQALVKPVPDIIAGAGASGLFDKNPDYLFDFSKHLEKYPESNAILASALGYYVFKGLAWWETQYARINRIIEALEGLFAKNANVADIALAVDSKQRHFAYRYASDLLAGYISTHEWVELATTGKKPSVISDEEDEDDDGDDDSEESEDSELAMGGSDTEDDIDSEVEQSAGDVTDDDGDVVEGVGEGTLEKVQSEVEDEGSSSDVTSITGGVDGSGVTLGQFNRKRRRGPSECNEGEIDGHGLH